MKKIISLLVIFVLSLTAILPVFSQKSRSIRLNKVSEPKTLSQSDTKLSRAEAFTDGNGVFIQWEAEYETKNLGFYVYRVGGKGTQLVSAGIVGGGALTSHEPVVYGGKYSLYDPQGNSGSTYYIESLGMNSSRQTFERFTAKVVENLASIAGTSSDLLRQKAVEANSAIETTAVKTPNELKSEIGLNSLPPDINGQRWVAAQQGVKIGVKKEGIYRVSRTELQNAGFNVSASSSLWQLYTDGKEQSINVGANDSYVEFYGNGIDTTESGTKVYYLVVGTQGGKRMETVTLRPLSSDVPSANYNQTFINKYRQIYVANNLLNGDAENFFGNQAIVGSANPTTTTLTFNLTGVDFNASTAEFTLGVQGFTFLSHQISPKLNGQTLVSLNGNGYSLMQNTFQIPTQYLREGANTLELQALGGAGDNNLPESIKIGFARKFVASQNRLSFYTTSYRSATVSGFSSANIRAFDLMYPDSPRLLANLAVTNNSGNYSLKFPTHRGRAVFATEDSGILAADSIVANTPSTLSTTAHNANLLIVSYKDWMTQANDWANYRRGQGMTVEVVNIEDVFDEFSYGSVSTAGMTQFFNYAKTNWQTPPNYVLLLGDTSYDLRNYENREFQNFIPSKLVDTIYQETGSDEAICDFDNDGLSEIAIGRIPARNAADVTQGLNKVMTFEANVATALSRGGLFPSDLPNGYDFDGLNRRVADQLPANVPKTFINRGDADAHTVLINELNAGKYAVNYSGHGSTGAWQSNFLTLGDATALTNAPNYSIFTLLTCFNGYFLRTNFDGLGEALLKSPNGGAVAVWASTGETTPDVQEVMASRFYNQIAVSNMTRVGDFVMDAKQNLVGGRDVRLSWVLLGDPTLRIK